MDAETRAAIRKLANAIDGVAGMAAGCAAYLAAMENAAYADKRKAVGVASTFAPEGLSGEAGIPPTRVAQAMIEQIASVSRELKDLKARLDVPQRLPTPRDLVRATPAQDKKGEADAPSPAASSSSPDKATSRLREAARARFGV